MILLLSLSLYCWQDSTMHVGYHQVTMVFLFQTAECARKPLQSHPIPCVMTGDLTGEHLSYPSSWKMMVLPCSVWEPVQWERTASICWNSWTATADPEELWEFLLIVQRFDVRCPPNDTLWVLSAHTQSAAEDHIFIGCLWVAALPSPLANASPPPPPPTETPRELSLTSPAEEDTMVNF